MRRGYEGPRWAGHRRNLVQSTDDDTEAARLCPDHANLIQDRCMTESATASGRRPQWRGERKAILVRVPIEVAQRLQDAASEQKRSVSEHAAWLLNHALDGARRR